MSALKNSKPTRPLRGLSLREVRLADTGVTDVGPLKGMPIDRLDLRGCKVAVLLAPRLPRRAAHGADLFHEAAFRSDRSRVQRSLGDFGATDPARWQATRRLRSGIRGGRPGAAARLHPARDLR